jgi:hypothetical protein
VLLLARLLPDGSAPMLDGCACCGDVYRSELLPLLVKPPPMEEDDATDGELIE